MLDALLRPSGAEAPRLHSPEFSPGAEMADERDVWASSDVSVGKQSTVTVTRSASTHRDYPLVAIRWQGVGGRGHGSDRHGVLAGAIETVANQQPPDLQKRQCRG